MIGFKEKFDVAIIGGGLAGLATSILLSRSGHSVVVFEKESYPFHKVCGEYISMESWNFLSHLGIPLHTLQVPIINKLLLTSLNGEAFATKLPLGGFGISRSKLDNLLAQSAKQEGVILLENTKVTDVKLNNEYSVFFNSTSTVQKQVHATTVCGAFGKKSNIDVKWKRSFLQKEKSVNYVGIKYHIQTDWEDDVIGLHNFDYGYCGISKIEENLYCLCYMTSAKKLKEHNNDIKQMEEQLLDQNKYLKEILQKATVVQNFPITISQITFDMKTPVENGVLMLGDAAGMITPLCGNGMSIALHTGKIAADLINQHLHHKISRTELFNSYTREWNRNFNFRLRAGRFIQMFFGGKRGTNLFVQLFKMFPFLSKPVIRLTHGTAF